MIRPAPRPALCLAIALAPLAHAADSDQTGSLTIDTDATLRLAHQPEPAEPAATPTEPAHTQHQFGLEDQTYFTLGSGVAFGIETEDATDINIHASWSRFLADDVEFAVELAGWYHSQEGDDTLSINPSVVFRWHFLNRDTWTLYTDAGIGVLLATDNTPAGGTGFNFTPRLGLGATVLLDDKGTRLQAGVRWHHISNARIDGDSRNPDRDGVMLYAGLIFPL